MKAMLRRFVAAKEGLETVEYAIIAGLITVGAIATIVTIGSWVSAKFVALEAALSGH